VDQEIICDSLGIKDQYGGLRGEIIIGTNRILEEFVDPFGNRSWRTKFGEVLFKQSNIAPIGAYQHLFTKLFNFQFDDPQRTNLRVGDLNNDYQMRIGVNPQHYRHRDYIAETGTDPGTPVLGGINISGNDHIFGFMIGDGGAREDNITAIAPDYKRRLLYHPIPFRITDNPDDPKYDGRYYGKLTDLQGTTSFYIKRFETTSIYPHIVHAWVTDDPDEFSPVDESVFSSTSSVPIESYVEMLLKIDRGDGSEYFERLNATPRINELGLVSGWYNHEKADWEAIHLITHLTRSSLILGKNDRLEIIYRLYAR